MISITSYAKGKKSSSSSSNGGGGFANTVIKNTNGISPFYLWGQYIDGRDNINGDLISNGTINGNKLVGPQGDIDLINALSEYVNYISGHTAIFDNLSGDTAHFNQDVFVGGDIDVEGDTNIGGDTVIEGDLNVSGDTHLTNLWTENITNSDTIKTKNLEVSGLAHFFQLVIDRIKSAGGAILLTPADGFETALVEEDASGYTLYFHAKDGEKQISNMWEVNDQAICQTFNASTGTSYNVSNTYYWALVTEVSEQAVEKTVSGVTNEYHYIKLSKSVYDGELNPKIGDEIAMLGSRNSEDPQRQSAIYLSAYVSLDQGLTAPCFAEYKGVNDFSLSSHRHSYIDATGASFYGNFRIDSNTTIQDYVNSATTEVRNEFRFDTEGLYSRVSKMTNPNILPANGWTDQDDKALLQEDDEEFIFEEPQEESLAKGGFSEEVVDEDYIGIPPVIYLNADTYTFSTYSHVKYEDIQYGQAKDNLNLTLPVQTAFISGDTWHNQERAVTTFIAPINGYYKFGAKLMDNSYKGDYEWVEPEDEGGSGHIPSEDSAITTTIEISMSNSHKITATITPSNFGGTVVWSSSNPSVATIDQQGNLTTIGSGTTTISATIPEQYWNGKHYLGSSDNLGVTVQTPQINYTPIPSGFEEGETHNLSASTVPAGGTLTYTSSNPSVASVDSDGIVSALTRGTTNITINTSAYPDNVNHIYYSSASTSVSVEVLRIPLTDSPYFAIKSVSGNPTVTVNKNGSPTGSMSYRKNGTGNWTNITTTTSISTQEGDYLEFKGNIDNHESENYYFSTDIPNSIEASGYLMALNKNTEIDASNNTIGSAHFYHLFKNCDGLISAKHLKMPIDTYEDCYFAMFRSCTSLTTAPDLPSTTLKRGCYWSMFRECSSLVTAPALPATTLKSYCYSYMFNGCSSLVTTPSVLPATTLKSYCYSGMFAGCSSLITPPVLSATTLIDFCCEYMFSGCTSLTTAPDLLATRMERYCYQYMFSNCSSLTTAPALSATILDEYCYQYMFSGCTSLTTAPDLPSTTLKLGCYSNMFNGCSSLVTPPQLIATTLTEYCYSGMFAGCSSLIQAPDLPSTTLLSYCYEGMFRGCSRLTSLSVGFNELNGILPIDRWLSDVYTQGTLYCPSSATYSASDLGLPSGWRIENTTEYNPLTDSGYFVIKSVSGNPTVTVNKNGSPTGSMSYRKNGTGNWTNITTTTSISTQEGDYLEFKGDIINSSVSNYYTFSTDIENSIEAGGWLMALSKNGEVDDTNNTIGNSKFMRLFSDCSGLVSAQHLKMASDTYEECYSYMFSWCTSLTTAPQLLSTTLAENCYISMFEGCRSLTNAPELPAKILAPYCYYCMFLACESLTNLSVKFLTSSNFGYYLDAWLSDVYTQGTLYCPSSATYSASDLGLPNTWTLSKTL
jgi:hypothetical protein